MRRLKIIFRVASVCIMLFLIQAAALTAADSGFSKIKTETGFGANGKENAGGSMVETRIWVGDTAFAVKLYDNDAAKALLAQLPLTLQMHELNGNEKYSYLLFNLPTASEIVGRVQAGDLMLFGSDCLALFYEGFDTIYSYTKLGHITDVTGLAAALGLADVEITFSKD